MKSASSSTKPAISQPAWRNMLGLFLFALSVRLLVIGLAHFDGLYGQDAFAYLDYTNQVLALHLVGPFYWPLGYPILAALLSLFFSTATVGAQATSLLFGSALPVLVYAIIDEILVQTNFDPSQPSRRRAFALLGGLVMALSGQVLQSSIVIMSDVPALFWATLSAFALIRLRNSQQWFWLPLLALGLALAIISRWIYAGLLLPYGIYFLIQDHPLIRSSRSAIAVMVLVLIVLSQAYFSQFTAAPVLKQSWLVEWNPLNSFHTTFDNPDGHFEYASPPLIFYAEPFFHPFYLFPLLSILLFPGIWQLRRSPHALLLGGWILTLYIYLIGIPYENFRFGLAFFPPIVILVSIGLAALRPSLLRVVIPLMILSILASLPFVYQGLSSLFQLKADELSASHYLQEALPPHSRVVTFSLTLTLQHYTDFNTIELYDQSPSTLRALTCSDTQPLYLFLQVDNIEAQWAGKSPQLNFHWFRDQAGVNEIGKQASWTLFGVKGGCMGAS